MRYARVYNATRDRGLAERAGIADNYWLRLKGLLGRSSLGAGEGLLITPCRAVHMFGMKFAIDVAFVAEGGEVVGVSRELPPGGKSDWHKRARHALELPAGLLASTGTVVGDRLNIEPHDGGH